jgi:hypothetical protein
MKEYAKRETVTTENGALGFKTTGHYLLDFSYSVPAMRNNPESFFELFDKSMAEDRNNTLRFVLFLRDIKHGMGERNSYRHLLVHMSDKFSDVLHKMIVNCDLASFGRFDDLIYLYDKSKSLQVKDDIRLLIINQLEDDENNFKEGNKISLLAKWLPSENASSKETKRLAKVVRKEILCISPKEYRKVLSELRNYMNVVEVKISANKWDKVDYEAVPSKANLKYRNAFLAHDMERRVEFLQALKNGEKKINSNSMFLYDIIHSYVGSRWLYSEVPVDNTLEQLWKSQDKHHISNTLVVRDGSGSMLTQVSSDVSALDIADSLTLYLSENNSGEFKNKFITFSRKPKFVDLTGTDRLCDKLTILRKNTDCSNTNIELTFDSILNTAVKANISKEEMPKQILIVSDMEFDSCIYYDEILFESIGKKFNDKGYEMPKLVFWNVCSRTNSIPLTSNKNGVILISGFSKNLVDMVTSGELDPYKTLIKQLQVSRYDCVDNI